MPDHGSYENVPIAESLEKALADLREITGGSMDINTPRLTINGTECAVVTAEGMVSGETVGELLLLPLMSLNGGTHSTPQSIMRFCTEESMMSSNKTVCYTYGSALGLLFSGFALVFVDGVPFAAAFGIQGYAVRAVSQPVSENELLASQEGFAEVVRTNISLIRRRIKHPSLTFEMIQCGKLSSTDVCIAYVRGKADENAVAGIRRRLSEIRLDSVLTPGYIQPFLERDEGRRLFSEVGVTERPDLLCTELIRGRIGVIVDGAPFALIVPYLFAENFGTVDDYSVKRYYAFFVKIMRWLAFLLAAAFPGVYLAAVNHDTEMLPLKLLLNLAAGEKTTLLSLFTELVVIVLLLEILREASIRLPHAIGTAMSIAGGLIIGDTAVKSGIISSPLLIIVGVTATASFVLPSFSQQLPVLRLMFIFAGGFAGFFGISACAVMLSANICSQSLDGVPFSSPAAPFHPDGLSEMLGRKTFRRMEKDEPTTKDLT